MKVMRHFFVVFSFIILSFPVLFGLLTTFPRKIKSVLPKKHTFCHNMETKSRKNQKIDYFKWLKLK